MPAACETDGARQRDGGVPAFNMGKITHHDDIEHGRTGCEQKATRYEQSTISISCRTMRLQSLSAAYRLRDVLSGGVASD